MEKTPISLDTDLYITALCCSGILGFLNMTTHQLNVGLIHSLVTGWELETIGITLRVSLMDGDWT